MKRWPVILGLLVLAAMLIAWRAEPLYLGWLARETPKTSLAERRALIEPSAEIIVPGTEEGPFPVVLQFHGCAGPRMPFMEQWAEVMNRAGYAAVIVDSTGPRGYTRDKALEVVCAGKALLAQERAGDILAALEIIRDDPRLDPSHVVLAGWSHGGWTVMDYLTMDMKTRRPAGLAGSLPDPQPLDGVILFYPHCGTGAWSRFRAWRGVPPVLALIAGADEIVDHEKCLSLLEQKRARGADIDIHLYLDANHVFDDPYLEQEWISWYREDDAEDAAERVEGFLRRIEN